MSYLVLSFKLLRHRDLTKINNASLFTETTRPSTEPPALSPMSCLLELLALSPRPLKHHSSPKAQVKLRLLMEVHFLITPSVIPPSPLNFFSSYLALPSLCSHGDHRTAMPSISCYEEHNTRSTQQLYKCYQNQLHSDLSFASWAQTCDNQRERLLRLGFGFEMPTSQTQGLNAFPPTGGAILARCKPLGVKATWEQALRT